MFYAQFQIVLQNFTTGREYHTASQKPAQPLFASVGCVILAVFCQVGCALKTPPPPHVKVNMQRAVRLPLQKCRNGFAQKEVVHFACLGIEHCLPVDKSLLCLLPRDLILRLGVPQICLRNRGRKAGIRASLGNL